MNRPALLVDIGSTRVKVCETGGAGGPGAVESVPRRPDTAPGEQVRALVGERHRGADPPRLRVCSSAGGGLRVGILGLTRRHSTAAAARAAVAAGGNVLYERLLGSGPPPPALPPVDVLVVAGGVDGAALRHLRAALEHTPPAAFRHETLVWAGAAAPDVLAALRPDRVAANVLDERLRPSVRGLAEVIHGIHVGDLADRKGLRALDGMTEVPVWPTPAVVGLAAERLAGGRSPAAVTAPFLIVDVGGATTDVFHCAELRAPGAARVAPGESVARRVFTDLGVAGSLPALRQRLAADPGLLELAAAVAPDRPRALYHALCEGTGDALAPPGAFLACLYLAVRRLFDPAGPDRLRPGPGATGVLVTGGAWAGAPGAAVRRVLAAACGVPGARWGVRFDRGYRLWARGLLAVPPGAAGEAQPPQAPTRGAERGG
ncbi:glutamate mutase L [Streptomyces sp. F63]|uniref:glutamate mutase L n=1 Tax=Streptomyces sp. F63 TaxID=2824887 RepID=UPI001B39AFAE|nr:glutamate mutase L [Streptomyces sp. F63]MBQ0984730.1 glutamate mutase L [Streptomyces sp. F63]